MNDLGFTEGFEDETRSYYDLFQLLGRPDPEVTHPGVILVPRGFCILFLFFPRSYAGPQRHFFYLHNI